MWFGPERRDPAGRDRLRHRVRLEFQELPGMSLTADQAARLFALRADVCHRVLEELVHAQVLLRKSDGREQRYVTRRSVP